MLVDANCSTLCSGLAESRNHKVSECREKYERTEGGAVSLLYGAIQLEGGGHELVEAAVKVHQGAGDGGAQSARQKCMALVQK